MGWLLRKILKEKIDHLVIVLLPQLKHLITNPQGKNHLQVETRSLRLAVWKVSGKVCKWGEYQAMLPNLSYIQNEKD